MYHGGRRLRSEANDPVEWVCKSSGSGCVCSLGEAEHTLNAIGKVEREEEIEDELYCILESATEQACESYFIVNSEDRQRRRRDGRKAEERWRF